MIDFARVPSFCLVVAAGLAFAGNAATQVITVGPAGSGAMFEDIQDGIAAAPPGGTVLVAPGEYVDYRMLEIDKPLTLLGSGSETTTYRLALPGPIVPAAAVRVTNLSAGQVVTVAGFTLIPLLHFYQRGVNCSGVAGSVLLADIRAAATSPASAVLAIDCAMLTIDACHFTVRHEVLPYSVGSQPALHAERSFVFVNNTQLFGAPSAVGLQFPDDGGPGLRAIDATVRLSRTVVHGGAGSQGSIFAIPGVATLGGAAIEALNSTVLVRGGGQATNSEFRGGQGGSGVVGGVTVYAAGGPAISLDATSFSTTTPDVALIPGLDGNSQPNTPAVLGAGAFVPLTVDLAAAAIVPSLVTLGGTLAIELGGEAGAVAVSFAALAQVPPFAVPGFLGVVTLDPATQVLLPFAVLDATGSASIGLGMPSTPSLAGTALHAQSITLSPGGTISVSGPTSGVLR